MPIQVFHRRRSIGVWLLDTVFPRRCLFCGHTVRPTEPICESCRQKEECLPGEYVRRFRINPYEDNVRQDVIACAPFLYRNVQGSMTRFKFENHRAYAFSYAQFMAELLKKQNTQTPDSITYVPATRERKRKYGYDQAFVLAKAVGEKTALPVENLLTRVRDCAVQHELSREKRIENVQGVFSVREEKNLQEKTVLLVDDIMTTGATVCACARALYRAGAKKVLICTACNVDVADDQG